MPPQIWTAWEEASGLDAEEQRITGVEMIASVQDAIAASIARHGDGAVAIVPEGPYVVPMAAA